MPKRLATPEVDDLTARAVGLDVAGIVRYHMSVLDREDRLESGTGEWRQSFMGDSADRLATAQGSVLRTLQMAVDERYFVILEELAGPGHLKTGELSQRAGIGRLTLHERVSDLVSAGLVSKIPEADQVSISSAGAVVVELVHGAADVAARDMREGG
jgi:DNA-binding HxlR family transcriptional regulator